MRNRSIFTSSVNFYISVLFIASFGIVTTSFLLKFSALEDPITSTLMLIMVNPDAY
ncbi:MAG: hypothetical protein Q8R25_01680 [bacterium]|nr:hypothetical protein [bacterium]